MSAVNGLADLRGAEPAFQRRLLPYLPPDHPRAHRIRVTYCQDARNHLFQAGAKSGAQITFTKDESGVVAGAQAAVTGDCDS